MRIASFNINGIKARLPRLKEWLEETRPTVACLQEIKTMDEGFPADEFEAIGYKAIWHGQKGFNGVAILADGVKPKEIQRGLGIEGPKEGEGEQARYLEADVNGVRICNLYLPNGNPHPGPKFDYKLAWMEKLRARTRQIWDEEVPAVVLGDFNVIPEEVILRGTVRCFDPEVRTMIKARMEEIGNGLCVGNNCNLEWWYDYRFPPTPGGIETLIE